MAKRKVKAKKTSRRRRRIGAMALNPNSTMVQLGSIALGFLGGTQIDNVLSKVVPANIDGKIIAAGEIGLGSFLVYGKGQKTLLKTVAGGLMIGAGVKKALTAFGVISGFQSVPAVGGYRSVQAVGAPPKRLGGYNPGRGGLGGYSTFRGGTIDGGLMANEMMNR